MFEDFFNPHIPISSKVIDQEQITSMRLKIFNYLIVALATVLVLYPALLVLGIVWQEHLQIVLGKQNNIAKLACWFLFSIPIILELMFFGHVICKTYQTYILNKQVRLLEKIWHNT